MGKEKHGKQDYRQTVDGNATTWLVNLLAAKLHGDMLVSFCLFCLD